MYKPKTVAGKYDGPRGVASVVFDKKGKNVKATLVDDDGKDHVYELKRKNAPKHLRPGRFNIRIAGEGSEMLSAYPVSTQLVVKFSHFAAKEGEKPQPKEKNGQHGQYFTFTALQKVVDGPFEGAEIPSTLPYNFTSYNGEVAYSKNMSRSIPTQRMHSFLTAVGIWDKGELPWKDNLLPMFAKIAHKADKTYQITIDEQGWVTNYSPQYQDFNEDVPWTDPTPEGEDWEADEEDTDDDDD